MIPTYNTQAPLLRRAISSALRQTVLGLEIVVVDDGGDAPFSGLREEFADSRIRWIALKNNRGVCAARNLGIEMARGAYVAFLDADDWWHPTKLEKQIAALESTKAGWSFTGFALYLGDRRVRRYPAREKAARLAELLKRNTVGGGCSSVVALKSALEANGGFDETVVDDWDMWVRLAQREKAAIVPDILTCVATGNPNSRSRQTDKKLRRLNCFYEKHADLIRSRGLLRMAESRTSFVKAQHAVYEGRKLEALGLAIDAFRKAPGNLGPRQYGGLLLRILGVIRW